MDIRYHCSLRRKLNSSIKTGYSPSRIAPNQSQSSRLIIEKNMRKKLLQKF